MDGSWWRMNRAQDNMWMFMVVVMLFHHGMSFCWCLNSEGLALLRFRERVKKDPYGALSNWRKAGGREDPCSWYGVGCSDDGKVVTLHLRDLCLEGTLAPELARLAYLKSIILRNNSFSGVVPKEIGELKELEVLDLGYNNFSGPFPSDFANNLSLTTLLLDNNKFLRDISLELHSLVVLSELQADENLLRASCNSRDITRNLALPTETAHHMLLQLADSSNSPTASKHKEHHKNSGPSTAPSPFASSLPPLPHLLTLPPSPFPSSLSPSIAEPPSFSPTESPSGLHLPPLPNPTAAPITENQTTDAFATAHQEVPMAPSSSHTLNDSKSNHQIVLIAGIIGGFIFLSISAIGTFFYRSSKVVTVRPWTTGLSGQLQKAFVTGVPKLMRSELEAACEDFSNIIGSFSEGTAYKGTLSSGVEIAVTSTAVVSGKDWSKNLEAQFRKKIDTLSKMNHKNFVNLIGFCEEDQPFTRMMVFEYAPNGTLFEHLHIREAEHLDWRMRLRIAMGMAYCLEHMHQLTPPLVHKNLQSSAIYLTEDYAAKISDFCFLNDVTPEKIGRTSSMVLLDAPLADPESNVYSFGVILFEIITGRIPFAVENGSPEDWALEYLSGMEALREMVDPTLQSFMEDELKKLLEVIKICTHPDPKQRPTMKEIAAELKEITSMEPNGATPKVSPLWWAELEIMSSNGS